MTTNAARTTPPLVIYFLRKNIQSRVCVDSNMLCSNLTKKKIILGLAFWRALRTPQFPLKRIDEVFSSPSLVTGREKIEEMR